MLSICASTPPGVRDAAERRADPRIAEQRDQPARCCGPIGSPIIRAVYASARLRPFFQPGVGAARDVASPDARPPLGPARRRPARGTARPRRGASRRASRRRPVERASSPDVGALRRRRRVFVAEKRGRMLQYDSLADPTPTVFADLRRRPRLLGSRPARAWRSTRSSRRAARTSTCSTRTTRTRSRAVPALADACPTPPGATADGCVVSGRLSRLAPGGHETPLITDWCQQYPSHSIGDLAFGPDGALYVSGGDGASFNFADYGQDGTPVNPCGDPPGGAARADPPTAEGGALRSQDARTPATRRRRRRRSCASTPTPAPRCPDNPIAGSSDPMARRIVAYGLRNPFRLTMRPGHGRDLARRRGLERVGGDQPRSRRRPRGAATSAGPATRATAG